MPRPKKQNPMPNGRPVIPIDWDQVDKLLVAGCLGTEIASYIGCHYQTFYDRVQLEKGMGFTDYARQKREKGDSILRAAQFAKAAKGDNTMLIWLGKLRLNQRDPDRAESIIVSHEAITNAMNEIMNKTKNPLNDVSQARPSTDRMPEEPPLASE